MTKNNIHWNALMKMKSKLTIPSAPQDSPVPGRNVPKSLVYHAKMCVFASRYMFESLKCLALHETLRIICGFTMYKLTQKRETIDEVLDLMEYVYNEDESDVVPELREIAALYATAKRQFLRNNERFELLVKENGTLGFDLWNKLTEPLQ